MAKKKEKTATQAANDYHKRNYDRVLLLLPKGARDELKAIADAEGVSVNRFILECVEERTSLKLVLDNPLPWINSP